MVSEMTCLTHALSVFLIYYRSGIVRGNVPEEDTSKKTERLPVRHTPEVVIIAFDSAKTPFHLGKWIGALQTKCLTNHN
jgi:hypothetical protein